MSPGTTVDCDQRRLGEVRLGDDLRHQIGLERQCGHCQVQRERACLMSQKLLKSQPQGSVLSEDPAPLRGNVQRSQCWLSKKAMRDHPPTLFFQIFKFNMDLLSSFMIELKLL